MVLPTSGHDFHNAICSKSSLFQFTYRQKGLNDIKGYLLYNSCTSQLYPLCRVRSRSRTCASRSFDRSHSWRYLAGLVDDIKNKQVAIQEYGGSISRLLQRGASRIGTADDSKALLGEQSSSGRSEFEEDLRDNSGQLPVKTVEYGSELSLKTLVSSKAASSMKDRLLATAQRQVSQARGFTSNKAWANYFSSIDASPGTPLLPFLGDSLLGFGSLLLVAVALVSLWKELQIGKKLSRIGKTESTSSTTGDLQGARAAVAAPIALSLLLQSEVKKKESVEWLNMVLGKVWNLYRRRLEGAFIDSVQPVIDEIPEKPPFVERVVLKTFFLGDEPVTMRTIERRTSRRANDLQYHIGLRYTGNSRMEFSITFKFGFVPIKIPVGIRGLDLDGEVWVKLRLIPTEPWVGTATWAFVSLPKVTLALAPFRLLNLMAVPFLNIFLTKLLTQDLPLLFVRPNKQVVNYVKGLSAGPLVKDFKEGVFLKGFAGELSITLLEARKLNYFPIGKSDPYVVFLLGEQVIRSKRNTKTSIIGPPGAPVWNQDFRMLVVNPETQKLLIKVRDNVGYFGLTTITVGSVEVPLKDFQDTVPVDKILPLKTSRWLFLGQNAGELLVRLTYKAYVEDEEETGAGDRPVTNKVWNEIGNFISKEMKETDVSPEKRELRDSIVMSVDAKKGDNGFRFSNPLMTQSTNKVSPRNTSGNGPVVTPSTERKGSERVALVENPALKEQEMGTENQASQLQRLGEDNSVLVWLAIVAGVALLVALDLNLSNLFNP